MNIRIEKSYSDEVFDVAEELERRWKAVLRRKDDDAFNDYDYTKDENWISAHDLRLDLNILGISCLDCHYCYEDKHGHHKCQNNIIAGPALHRIHCFAFELREYKYRMWSLL
jgi:sulfatase maturation enzyme AslB (radical SAM superfamily)